MKMTLTKWRASKCLTHGRLIKWSPILSMLCTILSSGYFTLSYWHRNPRTPVYHRENLWVKTSFKNDSFNCSHRTSARNEYTVRREAVARLMLRQMFSVMPLDNPSNPWKTRSLMLFLWVYLIYLSWQSFKILSHGSLWKSLQLYQDRATNSTT